MTLATSLSAMSKSPPIMSHRRPSTSRRYPVGKLTAHLPMPNTVGIAVTIR